MTNWAVQVDNNAHGKTAKVEIRELVLEHVQPARVFDAFCGVDGIMHRAVWHRADAYIGCDLKWDIADERPRYCGDSLRVLRNVDLSPWNVFDIDCYGDPWSALHIIMHRRFWAKGELGAVVFTDGSAARTRFGRSSKAIQKMTGLPEKFAPTHLSAAPISGIAIANWINQQELSIVKRWTAAARNSKQFESIRYTGLVFRGGGVDLSQTLGSE